ncbi:elongation factor Ts [Mycoplasma hyopneumoniae]|uniref:translation elongation factor Ts n=1 Tax=Mesomycoplasma hyopneumoniae TaxID=2099 RepID=UPI0013696A9F|nr:translation elongation factor Ts [Mesomycoplasma hyopneumoniae]MXR12623.1 elongation factor Ts [Mesomycoplasma hyopneumoniae]
MSQIDKMAKIKKLREISDAPFVDCKKALENSDYDIDLAINWLNKSGKSKALKKSDRIAAEGLVLAKKDPNSVLVFELNSETDFVAKNQNFINLQQKIGELLLANDFVNLEDALLIQDEAGRSISELMILATATIGEKITLRRVFKTKYSLEQSVEVYTHSNGQIAVITILKGGNLEIAKDISMHVAALNPQYILKIEVPNEKLQEIQLEVEKKAFAEVKNFEKKPENVRVGILKGMIDKQLSEFVLELQPLATDGAVTVEKYLAQNSATLEKVVRFEVGEGIQKQNVDFSAEVNQQIQEFQKK